MRCKFDLNFSTSIKLLGDNFLTHMNTFSHSRHSALMMQVVALNMETRVNQVGCSRLQQFYLLNNHSQGKSFEGKPKNMSQKKRMIMTAKKKVMKTKQLTNRLLEEEYKLVLTYDQGLHNNNYRGKSSNLRLIRMMSRWKTLYHWMDLIRPKSHRTCKIRRRQRNSRCSNDSITFKRKKSC
jgi:hypothetical protein